jgi:hypothetical protein
MRNWFGGLRLLNSFGLRDLLQAQPCLTVVLCRGAWEWHEKIMQMKVSRGNIASRLHKRGNYTATKCGATLIT